MEFVSASLSWPLRSKAAEQLPHPAILTPISFADRKCQESISSGLPQRRFLSLRFSLACAYVPRSPPRPAGPKEFSPRREPWDLFCDRIPTAPVGAKEPETVVPASDLLPTLFSARRESLSLRENADTTMRVCAPPAARREKDLLYSRPCPARRSVIRNL